MEPEGAPEATQSRSKSAAPSYTGVGGVHTSASGSLFNTRTVTLADTSSAFSALAVSVYLYVSSLSTSSGTSNVGFAIVVLLNSSVFDVAPLGVHT